MTSINLYEAYAAVYDEDLREKLLNNLTEDFDIIAELDDEELDEIVEETIFDLLDEGYEIEDIENVFEQVLSEAKVTMGRGGEAGEGKVTTGSGSRMVAANRLSARKQRKRKEAVEKVKGAVKKTVSDIKSSAKEAKFKAVDSPAAKYASSRGIGGPAPGLSARSKDPSKRRALRGAVLSDIASRAKAKLQRGVEKAGKTLTSAARGGNAGRASVSQRVGQAASEVASRAGGAKSAVKKGLRGALLGAARRLKEDKEVETIDLYNVVLEHLIDEGYADTEEGAIVIMANMSEEWREEILESALINL